MIGSARYWREIPQRYRYEAAKCTRCDKVYFPPRLICKECRGQEFEKTILAKQGVVESFTVIRVAPTGFGDEAPYAVGVIKLDDGVKLTAQIVDCKPEDIVIGTKVTMEFRKIQEDGESGIICYGYKFVPVDDFARSSEFGPAISSA